MSRQSKVIIIFGGSRSEGNTMKLLKAIVDKHDVKIINLKDFNISFYDYNHQNKDDDFLPLIQTIVRYEKIVFVSPIYWYSFSAQMKTFIDRFSDLLTIEKDLGRLLKGKLAFLISSGSDLDCPRCFEDQFKLTCQYLDMDYGGLHYGSFSDTTELTSEQTQTAKAFGQKIFN